MPSSPYLSDCKEAAVSPTKEPLSPTIATVLSYTQDNSDLMYITG